VFMLAVVFSHTDVKTLGDWARAARVSVGSTRGYSATAGLLPRHALDFARLLRVIVQAGPGSWEPARWLTVSDPRHLRKLLARGGLLRSLADGLATVETYLGNQWLVPQRSGAINCVANPPNRRHTGKSAERSASGSHERSSE
jgi:hypothetical protein